MTKIGGGTGVHPLDVAGTLHFDHQNNRNLLLHMALNFGTQGAVIVFAIAGVLNNIAFCQSGFKLLFGQKKW